MKGLHKNLDSWQPNLNSEEWKQELGNGIDKKLEETRVGIHVEEELRHVHKRSSEVSTTYDGYPEAIRAL